MTRNINMPGGYDSLPIGKYLDILAVCEGRRGVDVTVGMLSVLTGMAEDDILDLPIGEFAELAARARFLEDKPGDARVRSVYTLGEFTLVPVRDVRKVTAAQYIDFQTFSRRGISAAPGVLSCMLVPEGRRYADGYDPVDVQKAVAENLPVADAFALYAFFLGLLRKSTADILTSSAVEAAVTARGGRMKMLRLAARMRARLLLAGAGWRASTRPRRRAAVRGRRSGR